MGKNWTVGALEGMAEEFSFGAVIEDYDVKEALETVLAKKGITQEQF